MPQRSRSFDSLLRFLLWAIWLFLIFILSDQPKEQSDVSSGRIVQLFLWIGFPESWILTDSFRFLIRKIAHLTEYAILFVLTYTFFRPFVTGQSTWRYAYLFCLGYACTDEFHQYFVPGRTAQMSDIGVDMIGALIGVLLVYLVEKYLRPQGI